ncbi:hypothetical protein [Archangium violaceum]|uniref:Uncharacterized protein n=1 Tax=Archangium violaceum Cb vi76 TaxID=1406225 RepID=A0A084SJR4_9BACT|nr:hypothetical protein [Archangium violaceum]KFA88699.1 hypothetical protein Q664_39535 [Archangium violaceum Cb vi76]
MGQIDPNRIRGLANHTLEKALSKSATEPLSLESLSNASLTESPVEGSSGELRASLSFTIPNDPTPQVVAARTDPMRLAFDQFASRLGVEHSLRIDMKDPFTLSLVLVAQGSEEKVRAFTRAAVGFLRE